MNVVPAIYLAAAAVVSILVGRLVLVKAALAVHKVWALVVLLMPFGPVVFSLKYGEQARATRFWRMATGPLLLLFFLDGGNISTIQGVFDSGKTQIAGTVDDSRFPAPGSEKTLAAAAATPAPAAKPGSASPAVTAANAAMPNAPKLLSPAERIEANRKEIERLAEWYENLKHERGYLRKGDIDALNAYNEEAAKYQTAVQLAKTEQAELAKLTARK